MGRQIRRHNPNFCGSDLILLSAVVYFGAIRLLDGKCRRNGQKNDQVCPFSDRRRRKLRGSEMWNTYYVLYASPRAADKKLADNVFYVMPWAYGKSLCQENPQDLMKNLFTVKLDGLPEAPILHSADCSVSTGRLVLEHFPLAESQCKAKHSPVARRQRLQIEFRESILLSAGYRQFHTLLKTIRAEFILTFIATVLVKAHGNCVSPKK